MENSIHDRRKALGNNKYDPTLALAFALARELATTVDVLFSPQ